MLSIHGARSRVRGRTNTTNKSWFPRNRPHLLKIAVYLLGGTNKKTRGDTPMVSTKTKRKRGSKRVTGAQKRAQGSTLVKYRLCNATSTTVCVWPSALT